MINRALLRIKIIQIIYSFYKNEGTSLQSAVKELLFSIEKTYQLYFHLLSLSIEVTRYAENKIDIRKNKLRPTEEELHPNTRFVDNQFVKLLAENTHFQTYTKQHKISWVNEPEMVKTIYEQVMNSEYYKEYMEAEKTDLAADKDIWRKIYKKILLQDEDFYNSIEDQSIYWTDDLEIIVSFIIKTIKKLLPEEGASQELLPMFKDNEDEEFAVNLLTNALKNGEEYRKMIDEHSKNWEFDRIAFMDIIIMQAAIAEIITFPTIPVNVTLNEYIEISKNFSTDRSAVFINGMLDNIVKKLKSENKLIKVVKI